MHNKNSAFSSAIGSINLDGVCSCHGGSYFKILATQIAANWASGIIINICKNYLASAVDLAKRVTVANWASGILLNLYKNYLASAFNLAKRATEAK